MLVIGQFDGHGPIVANWLGDRQIVPPCLAVENERLTASLRQTIVVRQLRDQRDFEPVRRLAPCGQPVNADERVQIARLKRLIDRLRRYGPDRQQKEAGG